MIGAAHAFELILSGREIDAREAERIGLVSRVVPDAELLDVALESAEHIAALSPHGVAMTKRVLWSNLETGSLHAAMDLESRNQLLVRLTTNNLDEAIRARKEGRAASAALQPTDRTSPTGDAHDRAAAQEGGQVEARLIGRVAVGAADGTGGPSQAADLEAGAADARFEVGRRSDASSKRAFRKAPTGQVRRHGRSAQDRAWARPRVAQAERHSLGEEQRAAVGVPEAVVGMDQQSQRRGVDGLGPLRPALERGMRRAVVRQHDRRVERRGDDRERARRPAVERIALRSGLARRSAARATRRPARPTRASPPCAPPGSGGRLIVGIGMEAAARIEPLLAQGGRDGLERVHARQRRMERGENPPSPAGLS